MPISSPLLQDVKALAQQLAKATQQPKGEEQEETDAPEST